jgi:hypothetical protein
LKESLVCLKFSPLHPFSQLLIHGQSSAKFLNLSLFQEIDEPVKIDEPALISLFQEEEVEPRYDMMDLFKKSLPLFSKFEAGMKEMEEVEISHPPQGGERILFLENENDLGENPPS